MKTYVYIDGFNLYYGALKGTTYRWLNPKELVSKLVRKDHELEKIKYFTARISPLPGNPDAPARQDAYIRALRSLPEVEVIYGHFLTNEVFRPRADGTGWVKIVKTEEKEGWRAMPVARRGRKKSRALQKVATFWKPIRTGAVRASQFPDVVTADGQKVRKPERWK